MKTSIKPAIVFSMLFALGIVLIIRKVSIEKYRDYVAPEPLVVIFDDPDSIEFSVSPITSEK